MGDVVNLNHFRKKQERKAAKDKASQNRRAHGRTKAERKADEKQQRQNTDELDHKKLENKPKTDDSSNAEN